MISYCNGCQKDVDFAEIKKWVIPKEGKALLRFCRSCFVGMVYFPDIYFDGKPQEDLADDPRTGKPRVFSCRSEQAQYLKERGLSQVSAKESGAPVMFHKEQNRRIDTRHEVQMALKKVKEMGRDVRRSEYQRIMKEGYRHHG
jgi:hypothetical protein